MRREIAQEEQAASAAPGFLAKHAVSVLGFITMGLDIEDQQYVNGTCAVECIRLTSRAGYACV